MTALLADAGVVDTNVLVAAHIREHEHHDAAGLSAAGASHVLGQVTVEAWSVLRRHFRLSADAVAAMLLAYIAERALVPPTEGAYQRVLRTGRSLALAGNVHDAVIVQTAADAGLHVSTLDAGLHRLADGVIDCTLISGGLSGPLR